MMLITCPHCGPRALPEFSFDRPVEAITRPGADTATLVQNLFTRDNPRGPSRELWRHTYGCRSWLTITRDTATHEITDVQPVGGAA
jgi:heterotetrameric sarcosine oxidase delta subunit